MNPDLGTMRSRSLATLFSGFLLLVAKAQDADVVDPLRRACALAPHDSVRVKTLLALAEQWLKQGSDSAYAICQRAS